MKGFFSIEIDTEKMTEKELVNATERIEEFLATIKTQLRLKQMTEHKFSHKNYDESSN